MKLDWSILKNQNVQIAIGGLLLIVLLFKTNILKSITGTKFKIDPNDAPPRVGLNPLNEAIALHEMLSSYDLLGDQRRKEGLRKIVIGLNNNELKLVENAYRREFKGTKYSTIRKLVQSEWISPWNTTSRELQMLALEKLSSIGA